VAGVPPDAAPFLDALAEVFFGVVDLLMGGCRVPRPHFFGKHAVSVTTGFNGR
jgi:hypothetical protein